MDAAEWREAMREWALPAAILAAAPESPWGFPAELFRSRAERATPGELTFTNRRARDALPNRGIVVDVGVGGGAASLPLVPRCSLIVGVDASAEQLSGFQSLARQRGVAARTIEGAWPEVAARTPVADVVVCNHVAYNVADLAPFVEALTAHARRRVVMELTSRHPLAWMDGLWLQFHGLIRPLRPDAEDVISLIRGLGVTVHRHAEVSAPRAGGFARREDAVAMIRRRLCLDATRDAEVAAALGGRLRYDGEYWSVMPPIEPLVTLWWDVHPEVAE